MKASSRLYILSYFLQGFLGKSAQPQIQPRMHCSCKRTERYAYLWWNSSNIHVQYIYNIISCWRVFYSCIYSPSSCLQCRKTIPKGIYLHTPWTIAWPCSPWPSQLLRRIPHCLSSSHNTVTIANHFKCSLWTLLSLRILMFIVIICYGINPWRTSATGLQ